MVEAIRNIEKTLSGSGYKEISPLEAKKRKIARKRIVAKINIKKEKHSRNKISPRNVLKMGKPHVI